MMLGRDLETMFPQRGTLGGEPLLAVEGLLAPACPSRSASTSAPARSSA